MRPTSQTTHRLAKATAICAAVAAIAAAPLAHADANPAARYSLDARALHQTTFVTEHSPGQNGNGSSVQLITEHAPSQNSVASASSVRVPSSGNGFDWFAAAVGAASLFGVMLIGAGAALAARGHALA